MHSNEKKARDRILTVAGQHFAVRGYHGSSVRQITEDAQVNLAAINYHFRNKDSLYCEVLSSVLRPLNQRRIEKLDNAMELAGNASVPLSMLVEILVEPLFELCGDPVHSNSFLARLIGRSVTEPLPFIQTFLANNQHAFTTRFAQAIRRHAPKTSAAEFMWRLSFVIGALHHTLATMHSMSELTRGLCPNNDVEQTTAHFVQFAVDTIQGSVKVS
jgi:AcrR family transcriptional regulator